MVSGSRRSSGGNGRPDHLDHVVQQQAKSQLEHGGLRRSSDQRFARQNTSVTFWNICSIPHRSAYNASRSTAGYRSASSRSVNKTMSSSPGRDKVMRRTCAASLVLGAADPAPILDIIAPQGVSALPGLARRILVKTQLFVVSHEKVIAILGEMGRLHEVGKLPVGHPQSRTGEASPYPGQQFGHELHVVGVAVAVGTHVHGQAALEIHRHQRPSPQHAAASAPQRLQPLGHLLNRFPVEHADPKCPQRLGNLSSAVFGNICRSRSVQSARNPSLTRRARAAACRKPLASTPAIDHPPGVLETLPSAAAIHQQGVVQQMHEHVELQDFRVTTSSQPLEQVLQSLLAAANRHNVNTASANGTRCQALRIHRVHASPPYCKTYPHKSRRIRRLCPYQMFTAVVLARTRKPHRSLRMLAASGACNTRPTATASASPSGRVGSTNSLPSQGDS